MNREEYFRLFDQGENRKGTDCIKWDTLGTAFGKEDLIPLWIADMDFASPPSVREALVKRAQHGVYGYSEGEEEAIRAACRWEEKRHGLKLRPEQVILSPGVVDSLAFAVNAFTKADDTVVIQPPVYGPFERTVRNAGRKLRMNPLMKTPDGWRMDLDDLETAFREGARMLLLCSPHNPVGRIWTREELRSVSGLCLKYGVRLVADEIHCDFEMPGWKHTPILSVDDTAISLISATKTFNLAGLRCSSMVFGQERDRLTMELFLSGIGEGEINLFATLAQKTAYDTGEEWLDALLFYLKETDTCLEKEIEQKIPKAKMTPLEGTYLKWIDLSFLGEDQKQTEQFLTEKCGLALSSGTAFTAWGSGYVRMNIATPRKNVMKAIDRIAENLK